MSIDERSEQIDFVAFGTKDGKGFDEIGIPEDQLDDARMTVFHGINGRPEELIVATASGSQIFPIEELEMAEIDGAVSRFKMVVSSLKNKAHEGSADARAFMNEHETELKIAATISGVALTGIAVSIAVVRKRRSK